MSLLTNLVAYWKLDEASGDAIDAHGSNTLADNNTVGSTTGKINNGRDFERGNDEYFVAAHNSDLTTGDISYSWSLWVSLESKDFNGVGWIITKYDDAVGFRREYEIDYLVSTDRFRFVVRNSAGTAETTVSADNFGSPSTGVLYHIVCTHDATNDVISICVNNGTPNTASHMGGGRSSSSVDFRIGSAQTSDGNRSWDGVIDEVGFWKNRVLNSSDISELYNGGAGKSYSSFGGVTTKASIIRGSRLVNNSSLVTKYNIG